MMCWRLRERIVLFLCISLVQNGDGWRGEFEIPESQWGSLPRPVLRSMLRRIRGYTDVFFSRAHCLLLAYETGLTDTLIVNVTTGLNRPVIAMNAIETLLTQRYCWGLVILAETPTAVSSFMRKAVLANWSFRVLALMVPSTQVNAGTLSFTVEELNQWRSYDMLWIEFGHRKFNVRQYLIHQDMFQPTNLFLLSADLKPNKLMNFYQREMNVTAFSCPLFVVFKRKDEDGMPSERKDIDGIEYRIFLEFAKVLNFRWILTVPKGKDKWGMPRFKDEPPRGMVQMLIERKVELAICSWWLEVAKKRFLDLSTYWNSCCMTFLIPKPAPYTIQWTAFVRPFSFDLWLALILTFCFITCVYWMNFDVQTRTIHPVISFDRSFLQIYGMLLMNDGYNPQGRGNRKFNRFLLTLWGIFTLNIISAYSGSLAARLTLPEYEPMIHTPEELSEHRYIFSAYYLSSWLGFTAQKYKLRLRLINSTDPDLEEGAGERTAFFTKRVGDKFFMEVEQLPVWRLEEMRASKECIEQYFMTFAIPRGSGLGRFINPIIRRLVEAGITTHWLNRVLESQYSVFPFVQAYDYRDRIAVQVKLSFFYLQSAFLLWFVGLLMAAVAFGAELYKHRREENKIFNILRPDLARKKASSKFKGN